MKYKLKELIEEKGYIRGPFGSALKRGDMKDKGIPVYEQQNAIYNNRDFRYYIDEEQYQKLTRYTVRENDLVISCSGTVGRVTIISQDDPKGIISQALLILRPNVKKVLPKFLYYFFNSKEGYNSIVSRSGGSVQVNISKRAVIESIPIDVPSLKEQKNIVKILATLDEKIEVNNQINKTLEAMAQAIFKQWFVDFEFPNEDGEPYKSSGGEMVESELGMIPKGWEIVRLDDICNINSDSYSSNEKWEYIDYLDTGNITNNVIDEIPRLFEGRDKIPSRAKRKVRHDDIIFSTVRPNQKHFGILKNPGKKLLVSTGFAVMTKSVDYVSSEFIYLYITQDDIVNYLQGIGETSTSTYPSIKPSHLKSLKFPLCKSDEFGRVINELFNSIYNKIHQNNVANVRLVKLRDTLLPKLMSGEIRVPLNNEE